MTSSKQTDAQQWRVEYEQPSRFVVGLFLLLIMASVGNVAQAHGHRGSDSLQGFDYPAVVSSRSDGVLSRFLSPFAQNTDNSPPTVFPDDELHLASTFWFIHGEVSAQRHLAAFVPAASYSRPPARASP